MNVEIYTNTLTVIEEGQWRAVPTWEGLCFQNFVYLSDDSRDRLKCAMLLLYIVQKASLRCVLSESLTIIIGLVRFLYSYTRHTQISSQSWHTPRCEVDRIQPRKRNNQASELLKPRVEIRSCHKQHPPHQRSAGHRHRAACLISVCHLIIPNISSFCVETACIFLY